MTTNRPITTAKLLAGVWTYANEVDVNDSTEFPARRNVATDDGGEALSECVYRTVEYLATLGIAVEASEIFDRVQPLFAAYQADLAAEVAAEEAAVR